MSNHNCFHLLRGRCESPHSDNSSWNRNPKWTEIQQMSFKLALSFVFMDFKPIIKHSCELCIVHNNYYCCIVAHILTTSIPLYNIMISYPMKPFQRAIRTINWNVSSWRGTYIGSRPWTATGKAVGLMYSKIVRSTVHVIRSNAIVHFLHYIVPYKKSLHDYLKCPTKWENENVISTGSSIMINASSMWNIDVSYGGSELYVIFQGYTSH